MVLVGDFVVLFFLLVVGENVNKVESCDYGFCEFVFFFDSDCSISSNEWKGWCGVVWFVWYWLKLGKSIVDILFICLGVWFVFGVVYFLGWFVVFVIIIVVWVVGYNLWWDLGFGEGGVEDR